MSHSSPPTALEKLLPCPRGQVSPEAIKRPAQASSVFRASQSLRGRCCRPACLDEKIGSQKMSEGAETWVCSTFRDSSGCLAGVWRTRTDQRGAKKVMGIALAVLGWLGAILSCALPMWRVTAFIGSNIVTSQTIWEGLWMNCVVQSTGQMQCKVYDSLLALPQDLQAARALIVICIILAVFGVLLSVVGGKCTNCVDDESPKAKIMIVAGVVFLLAGLLVMVPVSWTANNVIRDFYNPLVASGQKREMGASLYVGWAAAGLLMLGGTLLCFNCPPRNNKPYSAKYSAARSAPASNYV
ncbi:hypothetical protein R6Z07F_018879 [Ovis aries]